MSQKEKLKEKNETRGAEALWYILFLIKNSTFENISSNLFMARRHLLRNFTYNFKSSDT